VKDFNLLSSRQLFLAHAAMVTLGKTCLSITRQKFTRKLPSKLTASNSYAFRSGCGSLPSRSMSTKQPRSGSSTQSAREGEQLHPPGPIGERKSRSIWVGDEEERALLLAVARVLMDQMDDDDEDDEDDEEVAITDSQSSEKIAIDRRR
jgi:hypothetical protein